MTASERSGKRSGIGGLPASRGTLRAPSCRARSGSVLAELGRQRHDAVPALGRAHDAAERGETPGLQEPRGRRCWRRS